METIEQQKRAMHILGTNGYRVGDSNIPSQSDVCMQLLDIFYPDDEPRISAASILSLIGAYTRGWYEAHDNVNNRWPLDSQSHY